MDQCNHNKQRKYASCARNAQITTLCILNQQV